MTASDLAVAAVRSADAAYLAWQSAQRAADDRLADYLRSLADAERLTAGLGPIQGADDAQPALALALLAETPPGTPMGGEPPDRDQRDPRPVLGQLAGDRTR